MFSIQLFQRCLIKVLNIDLWKCYLNYVRDTKGKLSSFRSAFFSRSLSVIDFWETEKTDIRRSSYCRLIDAVWFREKMAQAYDCALEKVGMDVYSYSVWNDYVTFLKAVWVRPSPYLHPAAAERWRCFRQSRTHYVLFPLCFSEKPLARMLRIKLSLPSAKCIRKVSSRRWRMLNYYGEIIVTMKWWAESNQRWEREG